MSVDLATTLGSLLSMACNAAVHFVKVAALVLVILLVVQYLRWYFSPLHKVPGPAQSFVSGAYRELYRKEPFFAAHKRWCQEIGYTGTPFIHYTSLLGGNSLLVLDRDIVRHILSTQLTGVGNDKPRYHKGPIGFLKSRIGDGLVTLQGPDWVRHRKIIQPCFQTNFFQDRLDQVVPSLANRFVAAWRRAATMNPMSREIDAASHLSVVTLDIVGEILFAHEFHGVEAVEEWAKCTVVVDDDGARLAQLPDPFLRSLVGTLTPCWITIALAIFKLDALDGVLSPRSRQMRATLNQASDDIVAAAEQSSLNNLPAKSLLHLLLKAQQKDANGIGVKQRLNRKELRDEIKTFVIAGHETTSTWLYWSLYALAKHPDVQERMYQDVSQHAPVSENIRLEHIHRMDYFQAFLQEVLRLYPPIGLISRYNTYPEEIAGYHIPVGTRFVLPIHILHRHPQYWNDPEVFQPERWLSDETADRLFLPFSFGGRYCIGSRFATLEAQLILAPLVRALRVQLAPSQRDCQHTFKAFITMKTNPPLKIVVQDRNSKELST